MNRQRAREIAQEECKARGWDWIEPIHVHWRLLSYVVVTRADAKGGNARIRVRKRDGAVVSAGFASY
jgi:hypothetical protein